MLWFRIGCTGDSGGSFGRSRKNRQFSWLRFGVRAGVITRRSKRLGNNGNKFLFSLEIPSSEKGSSWLFGCLVFTLVGGFLIVSSSNKAASLSCPVIVEIGGMSLSSSPNLGTLVCQGAGSSETKVFCPVTLDGVRGSGKSLSDFGPLGKCYGSVKLL